MPNLSEPVRIGKELPSDVFTDNSNGHQLVWMPLLEPLTAPDRMGEWWAIDEGKVPTLRAKKSQLQRRRNKIPDGVWEFDIRRLDPEDPSKGTLLAKYVRPWEEGEFDADREEAARLKLQKKLESLERKLAGPPPPPPPPRPEYLIEDTPVEPEELSVSEEMGLLDFDLDAQREMPGDIPQTPAPTPAPANIPSGTPESTGFDPQGVMGDSSTQEAPPRPAFLDEDIPEL